MLGRLPEPDRDGAAEEPDARRADEHRVHSLGQKRQTQPVSAGAQNRKYSGGGAERQFWGFWGARPPRDF